MMKKEKCHVILGIKTASDVAPASPGNQAAGEDGDAYLPPSTYRSMYVGEKEQKRLIWRPFLRRAQVQGLCNRSTLVLLSLVRLDRSLLSY